MLSHLPESRAVRPRRTGGTVVSLAVHTAVVAALLSATAHATVPAPSEQLERPLRFTHIEPPPPPPRSAQAGVTTAVGAMPAAPPDITAPLLITPVTIPAFIPDIDLTRAPSNPDDFATGHRAQSGGIPGGRGNAAVGETYFEWQVEKLAMALPGTRRPRYPDLLRTAGIEGEVIAQFVVDTAGRADLGTLQILRTEHAFFSNAVRDALRETRFLPAEVGGRKVPQLVLQTFQFRLDR